MGSKRLPGKSLIKIKGKSLVERIFERVSRVQGVDKILFAIPDIKSDDILFETLTKIGASVFRGSEDDVLDRYYQAAKEVKADYILRIPADNAFPDPREIEKIIFFHLAFNQDGFSTNLANAKGSNYIDGVGAEIFSFSLLEKAWKNNNDPKKREHVHLNFFDYETNTEINNIRVLSPKCPSEYSRPDIHLDINEREDLEFVKLIYNYFKNQTFSTTDIVNFLDSKTKPL